MSNQSVDNIIKLIKDLKVDELSKLCEQVAEEFNIDPAAMTGPVVAGSPAGGRADADAVSEVSRVKSASTPEHEINCVRHPVLPHQHIWSSSSNATGHGRLICPILAASPFRPVASLPDMAMPAEISSSIYRANRLLS